MNQIPSWTNAIKIHWNPQWQGHVSAIRVFWPVLMPEIGGIAVMSGVELLN